MYTLKQNGHHNWYNQPIHVNYEIINVLHTGHLLIFVYMPFGSHSVNLKHLKDENSIYLTKFTQQAK